MEYGSRVLVISRLAAVHLSELRFGNFGHLKNDSQSCLAQSDPQETVNLQSIQNKIHNKIFSLYAQDFGNVTSWHLGDVNFHVFPKPCPLDFIGRFIAPFLISGCKLTRLCW